MKKLNWSGFWTVVVLCSLAGGLNQNYENMLLGCLFGFIAGLLFGLFPLIVGEEKV